MKWPGLEDVFFAKRQIKPYLARTPMHRYPAIDELIGTRVYIKHENYQPVGAFKVRGGINLISQLSHQDRARGVIAASTGNHGQSIAYAANLFGVKATIVVPDGANPGKVAGMRGYGAEVIFRGSTFDEALLYCEDLASERGCRYVRSGDEPLLISGVATGTLEMLEAEPDLDVLYVPVGGGSGAAGACIVARAVSSKLRVVGVQSAASPAAYESWRRRELIAAPNRTIAEGLANGTPFSLPQTILWELLDDFVLVSDDEILQAMVWLLERAHTLAEGAGAAALAAAYLARTALTTKKVGIVCSGGNASLEQLRQALTAATTQ